MIDLAYHLLLESYLMGTFQTGYVCGHSVNARINTIHLCSTRLYRNYFCYPDAR